MRHDVSPIATPRSPRSHRFEMPSTLSGKFARLLPRKAQASTPSIPTPTPFRLQDLPAELRLNVYEQITIAWKQTRIPLRHHGQTDWLTVVNPSLDGVRILATSSQIRAEATLIIKRRLDEMLRVPPTLIIPVQNLPGAGFNMGNLVPPPRNSTFIGKLLRCLKHRLALRKIHEYRSGELPVSQLSHALKLFGKLTDDETRAIATFILRTKEFTTTNFAAHTRYLPIIVAISDIPKFNSLQITVRPSLLDCFKTILRLRLPHIGRTNLDFYRITSGFAYQTVKACKRRRILSAYIMLHLPNTVQD